MGQSQAAREGDSNASPCPQLCLCAPGPQSIRCLISLDTGDKRTKSGCLNSGTGDLLPHCLRFSPADA